MAQAAFDSAGWVQHLQRHEVDYVLVGGGFAATLHGARRPTTDLDVVPHWKRGNLQRLCEALQAVDARSTTGPPVSGHGITPEVLIEREVMTWHTTLGRIDTLVGIPDSEGRPVTFDDLKKRARQVPFDGVTVAVADLQDVIISKEFASRRKDAEALPELRRILATQRAENPRLDRPARQRPKPSQPPMVRPERGSGYSR